MHKKQVMGAAFWSLIEMFGRQGIALLTTFVLARILMPEEFGAAALIAIVASLASIFVDGGFSFALIQKRTPDQDDMSSVFWFNLLVAVGMAGGLCLASELVAKLLGAPRHASLVYPFAISIACSAASSVHLAILTKRLDYRRLAVVNTIASVISGVLAVVLASRGMGVWALGWQALANAMISTTLLWRITGWRPSWSFNFGSLRRLFNFGGFIFLSAVLDKAAYSLQTALIGRSFGPRDVGFYTKAEGTLNIPQSVVSALAGRILFPLFSSISDDRERMLRGLRQAVRLALFVNAPLMLGLMVCSPDVIRLLLGPNWSESAAVLSVLALGGVLWPIHAIQLNVLSGIGRSDLFFGAEITKKVIAIPAVILASHVGVLAVAWAAVSVILFACLVTSMLVSVHAGYSLKDQLRDMLPAISNAALMAMIVSSIQPLFAQFHVMIRVGSYAVVGAMTYGACSFLTKQTALQEMVGLIRALGSKIDK